MPAPHFLLAFSYCFLNYIIYDRHKQTRQEIDGLAVLDAEDAEAGAQDKYAAHDAQLHPHRLWHAVATEIADGVEHALPAEEDRRGKQHNPSVGSSKDGRTDEVERRVRIKEGICRFAPRPACCWGKRRKHRTDDGERADAIEQTARHEALDTIIPLTFLGVEASIEAVNPSREVEFCTNQATKSKTQDEKDGELALRHVGQRRIHAKHETAETEPIEQSLLVLLSDARAYQCPESAARKDGNGIDDGS